ncbi:mPR-like GPCR protein [Apiospora kogelbergensis]|uniref:mPR-like GPCR protein n=1 Tax=Apiospora kogelbergensis TaxID=1337665 RepID=UPI00312D947E
MSVNDDGNLTDSEKKRTASSELSAAESYGIPTHGKHPDLLDFDEIPEWAKDNKFVRGGYRPESGSVKKCVQSWFYLHNETINIHSHLIPAVLLFLGEVYLIAPLPFRYGHVICFGLSATYHTLMNHSHRVEKHCLKLDFVGIIILILGAFFSSIYCTFWCEPDLRQIYWATVGGLGAISVIVLVHPKLQGPKWRTLRLLTFVCTGLAGIAPFVHGGIKFGFPQMALQSGLPYYMTEGVMFLTSAAIYGETRFPEKFWPGRFDIFGSSHQIFHVVVVMATVFHLAGVMTALDYNFNSRYCSTR